MKIEKLKDGLINLRRILENIETINLNERSITKK